MISLDMATDGEERGTISNTELDLLKIASEDFEQYVIDLESDPFMTWGESVLEGKDNFNDVNFALLDLSWRVRLEDKFGGNNLKKIEEMVEKKGKRSGFIFAYTFLNSCHALEDDDEKIFVGDLGKDKYKVSDELQKFMTAQMENYLDSVEIVNDDKKLDQIESDVRALGRTVSRSLLYSDLWKGQMDRLKEEKTPVGDGYLNIENSAALFKVLVNFGKKEVVRDNIKISSYIDGFSHYERNLEMI